MTNPNLPQAIAALLPDRVTGHIEFLLDEVKHGDKLYTYALAFECHKALRSITGDCVIKDHRDEIEHQYGKLWLGGLENPYRGLGSNDEEAIFAAVLDWWEENDNTST